MKVKSILFFIYFLLAIITLSLLLVFLPRIKNEDNSGFEIIYTETNNNKSSEEENIKEQEPTNDETDLNENNETDLNESDSTDEIDSSAKPGDDDDKGNGSENQQEIEFATSLTVNLPKTINIYVGCELKLDTECICAEPSNLKEKVNIEISSIYNSNINNIVKDGLNFKANSTGSYKIIFSILSKTGLIERSVKLIVQDKENAPIKQISKIIYLGDTINKNKIFQINTAANLMFESEDIRFDQDSIIPIKSEPTNSNIIVYEMNNYYKIKYCFDLAITQIPEYQIEFENLNETVVLNYREGARFTINYTVTNREETNVSQLVFVETDNQNAVSIDDVRINVITLSINGCGESKIKVTYIKDDSVVKYLRIIVVN